MMEGEYYARREELQQERGVDLQLLSVHGPMHFYSMREILDGQPAFCEVNFYQEDSETNICFRYISARFCKDELTDWDTTGIPSGVEQEYKERAAIVYRIMWPDLLTFETFVSRQEKLRQRV